jgi:outer membrane protein OmpA-like peptidoglycan-associated protein
MDSAHLLVSFFLLLAGFVAPARAADCVGGGTAGAAGQGTGRWFSVGAFAGGHVFAEGTNLGVAGGEQNPDGARNGVLGGIRGSVAFGRWFVAEAELAGLATEDRLYQRKARVLGYRVNAVAPLMANAFRPFVLLGVGAMQVASSDARGSAGLVLDTKAEVHTGVGFDYRVLEGLSLRGDARVLQVPSKASWGLTTDLEAMVGATVSFGGRRGPLEASRELVAQQVMTPRSRTPSSPSEAPPQYRGQAEGPDPSRIKPAAPHPPRCAPRPLPAARGEVFSGQVSTEEVVRWASPAEALPPATLVPTMAAVAAAVPVATGAQTVSDLLERAREIRFEPGTVRLSDASLAFLDALAAALLEDPATQLEVVVHMADSGDAKKDLALSRRRADVIKSAVVGRGASEQQLLAIGRGSEAPVAPNLTRTGRLRNERVELHRVAVPVRRD